MLRSACMFALCALVFAACGEQEKGPGDAGLADMSASVDGGADLGVAAYCNLAAPHTDGQPCGGGCPTGTMPNVSNGTCTCYQLCNVKTSQTCPCTRRCLPYGVLEDGGVSMAVGASCVPENGPGERCGENAQQMPYGHGSCNEGLDCVSDGTTPDGGAIYCLYRCNTSADCPQQTSCDLQYTDPLTGATRFACGSSAGPHLLGEACTATDGCHAGLICDGTCKARCDGPSATGCSGSMSCQAVLDPSQRIVGYTCK